MALSIGALLALPGVALASADSAAAPIGQLPSTGTPLYDVGVTNTVTPAEAANAATASSTFTQFKANVKDGTKTFTYVMAGKNPAIKVANASSSVKTILVPVAIKFSNGDTWDPTVADSCDPGASALVRTQKSPIFVAQPWTWGGKAIGNGQATDAFQRAEFWKFAQPSGANPSYGVSLSMTTGPKVTITVPNADAATESNFKHCGNGLVAGINISFLQNTIQNTVIPALASHGVNPSVLPIFLLHNVVEYITTTSNCCVLGFHSAFNHAGGIQTYGISEYDNGGTFTAVSDTSVMSHEVAEWQNDPYVNNATKPWGHIGQVTGCQANLEVGDPLSGTIFSVPKGGFTYHIQELAFFSWFFHQTPSIGVNGWYSDQGKFKVPAKPCT